MESFLIHWGYAAVFLFGFLEACCIPIPSEITFGFAGVLASQGHLNIVGVIVVGTVAELIGSYISYGVGRAGGRPLVHRFGRYLLITRADIDRAERFVAGRGAWAIPVGRALPVVRTFVSLVAGIIEVPPLLFGVLNLIGTAVWVTAISLVGYGVGSAWHSIMHGIAVAGYAIALVVIVAIVAFIAYRVREVRHEAAHGYDSGGRHEAADGRDSAAQHEAADEHDSGGRHEAADGRGSGARHEAQPSPRSPTS
jgi:membrane protein DedA with SNARE-associated domain